MGAVIVGLHFEGAVRRSLEGSRGDCVVVYADTITELPVRHSDGLHSARRELSDAYRSGGRIGSVHRMTDVSGARAAASVHVHRVVATSVDLVDEDAVRGITEALGR